MAILQGCCFGQTVAVCMIGAMYFSDVFMKPCLAFKYILPIARTFSRSSKDTAIGLRRSIAGDSDRRGSCWGSLSTCFQYTNSQSYSSSRTDRYFCYFIRSGNLTYNGYTVNLNRRLKQHNGDLSGGAKSTRGKGPWEFFAVITSPTWTKTRALQVEWLCKYPTRKKPRPRKYSRPSGRLQSLADICERIPADEFLDVFVNEDHMQHVPDDLPPNIRLHKGFKGLGLRSTVGSSQLYADGSNKVEKASVGGKSRIRTANRERRQ